jgi:hypothetical protein
MSILRLLTMFGPFSAAKFWIAAIMSVVQFIQVYFGIDLGLDQATVSAILGGLTALFVWLVPNAKKSTDYFPPRPGLY